MLTMPYFYYTYVYPYGLQIGFLWLDALIITVIIFPFVQVDEVKDLVTKEVVEKCGEFVCMQIANIKHTIDLSRNFMFNLLLMETKQTVRIFDTLQKEEHSCTNIWKILNQETFTWELKWYCLVSAKKKLMLKTRKKSVSEDIIRNKNSSTLV